MNFLKKFLTILLVSSVLSFSFATTGLAKTDGEITGEEVELLAKFITIEENQIIFDEEAAKKSNLSKDLVKETSKEIRAVNKELSKMQLKSTEEGEEFAILSSCQGITGAEETWFGKRTYLNSCDTTLMIGLLGGGASASTIGAVLTNAWNLPGTLLLTIAAAVQGLGAAVFTIAGYKGGGTYINWLFDWVPIGVFGQG